MILADVMKRWQQVKGREAFLSTGTDEHGMKIQQAAYKQEVTPLELCDTNAAKFMALTDEGEISQDAFIRTTQEKHKKAVEQFWKQLKQSLPGSIGLYKGTHAGWYSVDDECFYPEKMVAPFIDPQTGVKVMVCTETNSKVEWIEEETWFFPLTKYKDKLLQFYKDNPGWIQPESKMKEVQNWVENNLEDLSVTRPYKRLQWGIRDPDDTKHTIYVWVDALVNYLTVAGYGSEWHPDWSGSEEKMGLWPADVHVVGKDIIRFHAVYWPAMLLGLGLPLPKKILCHNHWKMSNRKMSKSVGNVVNPTFAVQRWGTDGLRYFLMRHGSLHKDSDYSNDSIYVTYTKDLQANLGNLYYRIFRPQGQTSWSTREAVDSFARGEFKMNKQLDDPTNCSTHYSALEECLRSIPQDVENAMDENEVSAALGHIYSLLSAVGCPSSTQSPCDEQNN
jgi:methionyl-tRNA synthetase